MRKVLLLIIVACFLAVPVKALDYSAPEAPEIAEKYMPDEIETFSQGLWYVIKYAFSELQPSITEAAGVALSLIAVAMLISILQGFGELSSSVIRLSGTLAVSILIILSTNALVSLGTQTITQLSDYGKLLLPVLAAALAAQGGVTTSTALYSGTVIFNTVLTTAISNVLIPLLYIYLCLCIACNMIDQSLLKELRNFVKWAMTWFLKIMLYIFTGYLGITGVISGTADSAAIKATKLTISGVVPVVGSLIADASETILVSAGVMKSAVGVYGLIAILATFIGPFLQIGTQYLILKLTVAVSGVFGAKECTELIKDFSGVMGFLLAVVGTQCLLLMISTVCFMKGIG